MAVDSGSYDDATLARRYQMAQQLLKGSQDAPVRHWAEGLAKVLGNVHGNYELAKLDAEGKQQKYGDQKALSDQLGLASPSAPDTGGSGAAKIAGLLGFDWPGAKAAAGPAGAPAVAASATAAPVAPAAPAAPVGPVATPAAAPPVDASQPRGFRNMNPGNIEDGPFARSQPGYAGSDGRFAKFASMDNGTGAMGTLLGTYEKKHGLNTVNGIINRWAPSSDGNNVNAYAANVAKQLGIPPDAPIPPEMRPQLIAAMAQHENGRPLPTGGGAQPAPYQVAGPPVGPPAAGVGMPAPDAAPTPAPAAAPQGGVLAKATPEQRAIITSGMSARPGSPAYQNAMAIAQKIMAQETPKYGFQVAGDNLYRTDPNKGTAEPVKDVGREVKPMTEEQRQQWKVPEGVAAGIDANGKPVFSQPSSVNTVSPVVAGINDRFDGEMKAAKAAPQIISSIYETRRALDGGAFTGVGSDAKLFLAKVGTAFGLPDDKVANTEAARAAVGNQVLESAKTLGANPSNADREYIEKVKGGSIALDEKSIRRIAEMQERWARDSIKRANTSAERLISTDPEKLGRFKPMLMVDDVPGYDDYVKNNPVTQAETPPPAAVTGGKDPAVEAEMRKRGLLPK